MLNPTNQLLIHHELNLGALPGEDLEAMMKFLNLMRFSEFAIFLKL